MNPSHSRMSPLRIYMIISRFPPCVGGAEIQCYRLSKCLVARGHKVVVLTEQFPSHLPLHEEREGISIHRFQVYDRPPISSLIYSIKAWRWLSQDRQFDVLHAHMIAAPALVALKVGRNANKPVVVTTAGARGIGDVGGSLQTYRGRFKLSVFKRWAKSVVAPREEMAQELLDFGIPRSRVYMIPNGVDIRYFHPVSAPFRQQLKQRLGISPSRRVAFYAGRCAAGKGVEHLIALWEQAASRKDFKWDLLLVLGGDPSLTFAMRRKLDSLKPRVHWVHWADDIRTYYQASDLAILLSEAEGLSTFLLEAMASGLPALTTEASAIAPLKEAVAWSRVIQGDRPLVPAALTVLLEFQEDPALLARLGKAAREKALFFDWEKIANDYEQLYRTLIQSQKGSSNSCAVFAAS